MTLSEKTSDLINQLESDELDDLSWRGIIDDREWKILIHRNNASGTIHIVIKPRNKLA